MIFSRDDRLNECLIEFESIAECPKQRTSPGREVVCYTSVSDVDQLTEAACKCTTLVQRGHDVRNLSVSGKCQTFQSFIFCAIIDKQRANDELILTRNRRSFERRVIIATMIGAVK